MLERSHESWSHSLHLGLFPPNHGLPLPYSGSARGGERILQSSAHPHGHMATWELRVPFYSYVQCLLVKKLFCLACCVWVQLNKLLLGSEILAPVPSWGLRDNKMARRLQTADLGSHSEWRAIRGFRPRPVWTKPGHYLGVSGKTGNMPRWFL